MIYRANTYSSMLFSAAFHLALLTSLWFIRLQLVDEVDPLALETSLSDETVRQELTQDYLSPNVEISETMNIVPDSVASSQLGTSGAAGDSAGAATAAKVRIETSENLHDPEIRVTAGELTVPPNGLLAADLGEREVSGETGAIVEGYQAALSRITQELIRLMREKPLLVVWLFDESESMKDDQAEIRENFHKVYEELGIVIEQDAAAREDEDASNNEKSPSKGAKNESNESEENSKPARKKRRSSRRESETLLTAISGFGASIHKLTEQPTADIQAIREAIDKIAVDESGTESMCQAISTVLDEYRSAAQNGKRRVVLIVVSDESGDDGGHVEEAIAKAKHLNAPIYFLGREAIFGYPFARLRWKDPVFGLDHWLPITRGPETPGPECLQWDGLHARWDSYSSGFGPYEQVRLARETGGIFFLLPGEEQNLAGAGAHENRKFDFLDMKQYQPSLETRADYEHSRDVNPFRAQLWSVILTLNPHLDERLNIRELYYPAEIARFQEEGKLEFDKAVRAMGLADQAAGILEKIQPLRAREDSPRWRAAFDLAFAQCLAYRVRLFQFILALDQHSKSPPAFRDPKSNVWNVRRTPDMLPPDPEQVKITGVDLKYLAGQEQRAREMFELVVKEHPKTPWARRAQRELDDGFGMMFVEHFHDPRYYELAKRNFKMPKF